jgi:hypothetical protein
MEERWRLPSGLPVMPIVGRPNFTTDVGRGFYSKTWSGFDTDLKTVSKNTSANRRDETMPALRDQVFTSYSHKDQEWLSKLQTMLKPLVRNKIISVWKDTKISAGDEWRIEIKEALARAQAAVLLMSPYFLESDFIAEHELPPLLDAAKKEGLVILWVYISHCLYDETEIEHYQAANEISKPLDSLTPSEQNRVLVDVCRKIKAAATPKSRRRPKLNTMHSPLPSAATIVHQAVRFLVDQHSGLMHKSF